MNNGKLKLSIVIIFLSIVIYLLFNTLEGLWFYVIVAFAILIIISYILNFIRDNYPQSKIGKFICKFLDWVKDFLENLLPFI